MNTSDVCNEISEKLSELWNCSNDDETLKKKEQFLKIFADVWREGFNYNEAKKMQDVNNVNARETPLDTVEDNPIVSSQKVPENDDIEELELKHEAFLVVVTKKRKEYPAGIASLLGKTRRLHKNTVEMMKVDLPPSTSSLEVDKNSIVSYESHLKEVSFSGLAESVLHLQPHVQRLNNVTNAFNVLCNNSDPTEVVYSS